MLQIDGSRGEGGGQILRTSLTLSMITGRPLQIQQIRAQRARPGLMRQHLTALKAAAKVCGAETEGAELGSRTLTFRPGAVQAGQYSFDIGTAGSASLVLQTILPPLMIAGGASQLTLRGGTHNMHARPSISGEGLLAAAGEDRPAGPGNARSARLLSGGRRRGGLCHPAGEQAQSDRTGRRRTRPSPPRNGNRLAAAGAYRRARAGDDPPEALAGQA